MDACELSETLQVLVRRLGEFYSCWVRDAKELEKLTAMVSLPRVTGFDNADLLAEAALIDLFLFFSV